MIKSTIPTYTIGGTGILTLNTLDPQAQTIGITTTGLAVGVTSVTAAHTVVLPAAGASVASGTVGLSLFGSWTAKTDKPTTGTGATGAAPGYLGALYLDTSALTLFVGVTTSAGASSWVALN